MIGVTDVAVIVFGIAVFAFMLGYKWGYKDGRFHERCYQDIKEFDKLIARIVKERFNV